MKQIAPAYGPVMGIATAIIALGIVVTVMVGPEKRGRHFELAKVAGEGMEGPMDIEAVDPNKREISLEEAGEKKHDRQ